MIKCTHVYKPFHPIKILTLMYRNTPQSSLMPLPHPGQSRPPRQPLFLLLLPQTKLVLEPHMNGIILYVHFCVWLHFLKWTVYNVFEIHECATVYQVILFFLLLSIPLIYLTSFDYPFHLRGIMNKFNMYIILQVLL